MAGPENGAVSFEAGGATHELRFKMNALVALERKLGKGITEIGASMGTSPSIEFLRTVFWGGLLHEGQNLTEDQAGDLMDELGLANTGQLIAEAFQAAFPEASGEAAGGAGRPRKRAGTGAPS